MELIFIIYGAFIFFNDFASSQTEMPRKCEIQNLLNGACVPIHNCQLLFDKVRSPYLSSWDRTFLRRTQCGVRNRIPYVCCPEKLTESDMPTPGVICGVDLRDEFEAKIFSFTWSALILYNKTGTTDEFLCGGALINRKYVLTAAHCLRGRTVMGENLNAVSVRLGEHDIKSPIDCEEDDCAEAAIDVPIAEIIVHENYLANSTSQSDDIALIRLALPVDFTDSIKPICLPFAPHLKDNEPTFLVAGFGRIEHGNSSDFKKQARIEGINLNECNDLTRSSGVSVTEKQSCAKGTQICRSDSGGPLMASDRKNRLRPYTYLSGILSQGPKQCGKPESLAIFTRVDQYLDWILNHMWH